MYNSQDKFFELVGLGTENNKWDYKRDIYINPNIAFANLLKDILAFSNSGGGWLVFVEGQEHIPIEVAILAAFLFYRYKFLSQAKDKNLYRLPKWTRT
ncbi:hypothetical protein JNUCC31_32905 [Paenibacillus sp. JNUCC31]|uniref:hypothetical protein n=1 Tax=Paenibacillus sp. JNUCC-31 TaxID=2777983 RepID=UPI00177CFC5B|nr:hypothetical protein [Paenibacillus sp. JNUCC-31]QOS79383.1 hypothetical protein JNUCC31_32905 [Paenibacillus sp. JNUCC-31]